jgi:DNA-directed RNA polymerase subunit RPC12/RpoP
MNCPTCNLSGVLLGRFGLKKTYTCYRCNQQFSEPAQKPIRYRCHQCNHVGTSSQPPKSGQRCPKCNQKLSAKKRTSRPKPLAPPEPYWDIALLPVSYLGESYVWILWSRKGIGFTSLVPFTSPQALWITQAQHLQEERLAS